MKKLLLLSGFLFAVGVTKAQDFTVDDTSSTGLTAQFYVMDSLAPNLAAIVGTGVTWNYDTLTAYEDATLPNQVVDASSSSFSSDFPSASYNDDLSTGASLFFSNTADSVIVYGYVFTADGNEVIVKHNIDPLKSMEFPMSVGDSFMDDIEGEVEVGGIPFETTGSATITLDGSGTLIVSGNTHTNVIRVRTEENIDASITFPFPASGTVTRIVYNYYDLASSKLPIFIHATIAVDSDALTDSYSAVYYSGTPDYFLGAEENKVNTQFSVYPNPANNVVTIALTENAEQLTVINSLGQIVFSVNNPSVNETIDLSNFSAGIYLVQVTSNGNTTEQKLVVE